MAGLNAPQHHWLKRTAQHTRMVAAMKVFSQSSNRAGASRTLHLETDCNGDQMPQTGDNIQIPLKPNEALRLLMQVKPTADMPRQGAAYPAREEADEEG